MESMERVIMIHEVNPEILNTLRTKTTKDDIFTFDDGLYSNYKYLDELLEFPNKKIFFFSTAIVRPEIMQARSEVIHCADAHRILSNWSKMGLDNYMSLTELKEINTKTNCFIGVHGHKHIEIMGSSLPRSLVIFNEELKENTKELLRVLREDTYNMFSTYLNEFGTLPNDYCYPYNKENFILRAMINQEYKLHRGILDTNQKTLKDGNVQIKLYGKGRIDVNEL